MAHEDSMSRRYEQRQHGELTVERCIDLWLVKWARRAKRLARAEQRREFHGCKSHVTGVRKYRAPQEKQLQKQTAQEKKQREKDSFFREVQKRRLEKEEREAKWRRMNHRDITMAEIMGSRT
eukprot:gnl/MRDRNA2_/MRDRNA2_288540_c0_seq1.p1 gnl/MRDRNA2_/MRDRNA2_288540_c0~~gnl/MRDRNA2_/MRDRNA2_288540_c0_seq1.p1  ORF type:complete len:133 (-),score=32.71 gnl/MRDRNA2_/MRDRNA2_288540_c0_seq1:208-573(-)